MALSRAPEAPAEPTPPPTPALAAADDFEPRLRSESNAALRAGAFWSALLGLVGCLAVTIFSLGGVAQGMALPLLFSSAGGTYSAVLWWMARRERIYGWRAWIAFLGLVSLPTAFFLLAEVMLPAGAATFITGPISYLYFFLIVLSGFAFDFRLSAVAGLLAGAEYLVVFAFARRGLATIEAADPILQQDLVSGTLYAVKSMEMGFTGLAVGVLAVTGRRLVSKVLREQREKLQIGRLFGEYVSEEVKDEILRNPGARRGERKWVVVLFSDIRGFTTYSETAQPEEIVARLNVYFEEMVQAITLHGGVVDKFVGDAVMAVFGGVVPLGDPAGAALQAAVEMRLRLRGLNARWVAEGLSPMETGIGLHGGEVLQGSIGSRWRKEFTVIGDAVNTASRVEGLTKEAGCGILFTAPVHAALPAALSAAARAVGRFKVKGRTGEVELWTVDEAG